MISEVLPPRDRGFFVYILQCSDDTLYTGWTTDLQARLKAHNGQGPKGTGAKCTRSRRPVRLVYFELLADRSHAMKREAAIKKLSRQQKLDLIGRGTQ